MSDAEVMTGGCQCGAVRYRAEGVVQSVICHCRMCQKAVGNYFAPLVIVEKLDWTRGAPRYFRSSNQARRGFCEQCGTPLLYLGEDGSAEILAGTFDDPNFGPPEKQISMSSKLPVYERLPDIPHHENLEAEAAFEATVTSFQHPDHDTNDWPSKGAENE